MCFVLYAGTTNPIPRRTFNKDAPDLSVESLTERDAWVKQYFSKPEVQYIGSTSSCGCDFPHAMLQNGQWPEIDASMDDEKDEYDVARDISNRQNCEALATLLRMTGDKSVELFGFWDGDSAKPPHARENISADTLLDSNFRFKEQGFYEVYL
ncbi:MAG TPA: hypothetical protein VFF95_05240 [Candidatus Binatus sp.]|jgi:hypothetical protein|nr:hypothetical protein [Candidatus Binatus sp.]